MGRQVSDDELRAAAEGASSLTELSRILGRSTRSGSRKQLRRRLERLGVETARFDYRPKYTREVLSEAAAASVSIAGVVRFLGLPQAGGTQRHIGRRLRELDVDTSHFTGQAHGRGKASPGRRTPSEILVVREPGSLRVKRPQLERAMLASGVPYTCAGCGCEPLWRGLDLRLHIDHINGDWLDNRLMNLRFLCPNCHSQTDTYCRNRRPRPAAGA